MGLSPRQAVLKRTFDLFCSITGLALIWWLLVLAWLAATIDTRENGFFTQQRVGRNGRLFKVIKIRSMRKVEGVDTTVTTEKDPRITPLGRFLRRAKIDELPQLINVLLGHMSFVGPRPDVPGFADKLCGEDRIVLSVRPGITGPAAIAYRNEEEILSMQEDPELYNKEVIFPDKVRMNVEYVKKYSIINDIKYIFLTLFHG